MPERRELPRLMWPQADRLGTQRETKVSGTRISVNAYCMSQLFILWAPRALHLHIELFLSESKLASMARLALRAGMNNLPLPGMLNIFRKDSPSESLLI